MREVKDDDEERRERKTVEEVNQGNNNRETTCLPVKTFGNVTDDRVVFLPSCFCVHKDVVGVI